MCRPVVGSILGAGERASQSGDVDTGDAGSRGASARTSSGRLAPKRAALMGFRAVALLPHSCCHFTKSQPRTLFPPLKLYINCSTPHRVEFGGSEKVRETSCCARRGGSGSASGVEVCRPLPRGVSRRLRTTACHRFPSSSGASRRKRRCLCGKRRRRARRAGLSAPCRKRRNEPGRRAAQRQGLRPYLPALRDDLTVRRHSSRL